MSESQAPDPTVSPASLDVQAFLEKKAGEQAALDAALADRPPVGKSLRKLPAGWWQIDAQHPGHRGTVDEVLKGICDDTRIPKHWQLALLEAVKGIEAKAVELHGVGHPHAQGGYVAQFTVRKLF